MMTLIVICIFSEYMFPRKPSKQKAFDEDMKKESYSKKDASREKYSPFQGCTN